MTDYPNLTFVEFETESDDPPVSWFVETTPEQALKIAALLQDRLEPWQRPWVGSVGSITFDDFMQEFKENWLRDDDEAAVPAGD